MEDGDRDKEKEKDRGRDRDRGRRRSNGGAGAGAGAGAGSRVRRSTASKYDFVKVRVQIGKHFFVLSRFLVSRILMAIRVSPSDALALTLELKKRLVDNGFLDVTYKEMEKQLFEVMRGHGYGEDHISMYRMMSRFHNERVPLIIMICGTDFSGKSTLARLLAERLNAPAVLQTDVVLDVMRDIVTIGLTTHPLCLRDFESREEMLNVYRTECGIVSRGLQSDMHKCVKEGKILIVEGFNLDPRWFVCLTRREGDGDGSVPGSDLKLPVSLPSIGLEVSSDAPVKPWAWGKKIPTVVPFVVTIDPAELRRRVRHWLDCRVTENDIECLTQLRDAGTPEEKLTHVVDNLKFIQDELCRVAGDIGIPVVPVNVGNLPDTLDSLHDSVLAHIKQIGVK